MKWYGIQLGLWFRFLVYGIWRGVQENLILFPLVANQSYRHSLSISSRCAAPICWISLTLSMPFPNALTNYYLQIGLFFLLHHSQSNISVFCFDKKHCLRRTNTKNERKITWKNHTFHNKSPYFTIRLYNISAIFIHVFFCRLWHRIELWGFSLSLTLSDGRSLGRRNEKFIIKSCEITSDSFFALWTSWMM